MIHRSPFKSLLLPSILTANTVFTLLTLLWTPQIIHIVTIRHPKADVEQSLPMMDEDRNAAVRFVGIAIILSTTVGLTTFELIRRWHAFHDAPMIKAEQLGLLEALEEIPAEANSLLADDTLNPLDPK